MSEFSTKALNQNNFTHHYQFIYDLESYNPIGVEILFRSDFTQNPQYIFLEAKKCNRLYELETASISKAIKNLDHKTNNVLFQQHLFINIFPSTIVQPNFLTFMDKLLSHTYISKSNIVFEINEEELINDHDTLLRNIVLMKEEGYHFAVDDFGKGYGSIQTLIELEPSYIKLDKFFANNLCSSQQKQEMIRSMITYSNRIGTTLILEGIELPEELFEAKKLGVKFGQGFLLSKPSPLNEIVLSNLH